MLALKADALNIFVRFSSRFGNVLAEGGDTDHAAAVRYNPAVGGHSRTGMEHG